MDLTQIIAGIQGTENGQSLAKNLTDYLEELNAGHNTKVEQLTSQLDTLTAAVGIETGTTQEKIAAANQAIASLSKERDVLKTEKTALETTIALNTRQSLIRLAAEKGNANATVLEAMIADEEVKVEAGNVTVNNIPLKEWATEHKAPFLAALFPTEQAPGSSLPKTPPHSTTEKTGTTEEAKSAIDTYFEQTYKLPDLKNYA
jgi:hypothetical protein